MFDHLIEFKPEVLPQPAESTTPIEKATPNEVFNAQVKTTEWMKELCAEDDEEILDTAQQTAAREAFAALTTGSKPKQVKDLLVKVETPEAVRHIVAMLTAYDWEFVNQAKELRGMAVAKLVEETEHPDARIRLRAIELLGKVTEVALFTERLEVKKTDLSDTELDAKIKEKLARLTGVVDIKPEDVEEKPQDDE